MDLRTPTLESMLAQGFTKRYAEEYLGFLKTERESGLFDADYLEWAHAHGFLAESACAYGLNDANVGDYLNDYDYWRLWPLNGWQRIWINDKLTLHALLQDSDLAQYLPAYYYYTDPTRGLLPLAGSDYAPGMEGFLEALRGCGEFACKPCNGTEANGFHRLGWDGSSFAIDGKAVGEEAIRDFVAENRNYVFTEFIAPEAQLAAINPLIHTLRILVLNPTGADPVPVLSYLRFATEDGSEGSGANYLAPTEADIAAYNVQVNLATGEYGNGKLVYANRVVDTPCHPTSGVRAEGTFAGWDEMLEMLRRISLKVGACEYLGFDACLTDKGPRIMEINSHSGIKYLQLFEPIWKNEVASAYYRDKLAAIDALTESERRARNTVVR